MAGPWWPERGARWRSLLCMSMAVAVAGCDVSPVYTSPVFSFASSYSDVRKGVPVLLENAAWWTAFGDPVLNDLVAGALEDNLDLAVARERVIEARAQIRTVSPELSTSGEASAGVRGGSSVTDETGGNADLNADWLFDPWGGRKARIRAAGARAELAEAERDAARLLLLSSLAGAYVDLRFRERTLALRRGELRSRRKTLELIRTLRDNQAATRLDVLRAEALVAETQSRLPGLEAAIRVERNRIAVLLGQAPGTPIPALDGKGGGQPLADMPSDVGVPADLVRNRPDIRIAERAYYAAVADIGSARADLYPSLSLGGEISASVFGGVEASSYFFGPTLRLPALPDSAVRAQVEVQESQARQALTTWQSTVIGAIGEVEDALVEYAASRASVSSARRTVQLYRETVELTRDLITSDAATTRDLLDAEQSVAGADVELAENLRRLGLTFIALSISLGSGNSDTQSEARDISG